MSIPERFELEGLTIQQLRYFNAVAEGETFADAAAMIGISQSALSQGIARLEQVTGTRLLERDGRRRRLTDAGVTVANYAGRILGESETLATDLAAHRAGTVGRLRIGMIDAAALYLFKEPVAQFGTRHPHVRLAVTVAGSAELEQRLMDFRDDLAIIIGPAERAEARPLLTESMHLYGTNGADTWALYPRGSRTRLAIDEGLAARDLSARVVAESSNPAVLRELAELTGSYTVLPEAVASASAALHRIEENVAVRDVIAAVRPGTSPNVLVRSFLEVLAEAARG